MRRDRYGLTYLSLLLTLLAAIRTADECSGEVIAADSASDPAYSNGWQGLNGVVPAEMGMDNGGFGFLPWDFEVDEGFWDPLRSPYSQPHFIDTQPTSYNNLGAPAFALTNGNLPYWGYTTIATRPFAQALRTGDQVSVDIDNPLMQKLAEFDSSGFIIRLQTASGTERFGFFTTEDFNNDEWTLSDSRGDQTASGLTDQEGSAGFKFAFLLTGEETYRLTIMPRGGGSPLTFHGMLAAPGRGEITKIQFLMFGNGSGDGRNMATGEREFYFNNLQIEPGAVPVSVQKPSDCNQDGSLDVSDAVCLFLLLFKGTSFPCGNDPGDAGNTPLLDANGDLGVDISDGVWLLGYLFRGSDPPALGDECRTLDGCPDNSANCE